MKINWAKYVDHIYCIHYAPYSDRKQRIESELKRIGILDSGIFSWQLSYNIPKLTSNASQDNTYNHLLCYCNAKYMNYKRVMIIEDDSVFLKDLKTIKTLLDNLPNELDLCLFDYCGFNNTGLQLDNHKINLYKYGRINKYYRYFYSAWLASNYIVGNRLYDTLINLILKDIKDRKTIEAADHYLQHLVLYNYSQADLFKLFYPNNKFRQSNKGIHYIFNNCKTILSYPRMSVQKDYDNAINLIIHKGKSVYDSRVNDKTNKSPKDEVIIPVNFEDYEYF